MEQNNSTKGTSVAISEVRTSLSKMEGQFQLVLPDHIKPDKFVRIVMTAVQKNPALLSYDRASLLASCLDAAQDGLLLDGSEAALVPYKSIIKYMPMVKGICKKARQSGEIKTMNAHVVYSHDEYRAWTDESGEHFRFERNRKDRGVPFYTFAYAITKDNALYFEEISEDEMEKIERCARAQNSPWKGDFKDEMRRKSALRRLAKYRLPSSTDLDAVIRRDDDMYEFDDPKPPESKEVPKWMPGIRPLCTVGTYVANLKDAEGGPQMILDQIDAYLKADNLEWAEMLEKEAVKAGVKYEKIEPAPEALPEAEKRRIKNAELEKIADELGHRSKTLPESEKLPFEKEGSH